MKFEFKLLRNEDERQAGEWIAEHISKPAFEFLERSLLTGAILIVSQKTGNLWLLIPYAFFFLLLFHSIMRHITWLVPSFVVTAGQKTFSLGVIVDVVLSVGLMYGTQQVVVKLISWFLAAMRMPDVG